MKTQRIVTRVGSSFLVAWAVGCGDDGTPVGDASGSGSSGTDGTGTDSAEDGDGDGASSTDGGEGEGDGSGDAGSADGSTGDSTGSDTTTVDTTTSDGDSSTSGGDSGTDSTGAVAVCGDGQVEGDEVCDDGINDGSYGGCESDCTALAAYCGDAEVNGPETCDDGTNDGAYGGCNSDCLSLAAFCGDAEVNGSEACDDGTNDGAYGGCNADCLSLAAFCGDAEVNGPEECDDADADSSDGCLASCIVPESCLEIHDFDDTTTDGAYLIGPVASDAVFSVQCDMTTDGGGWTGIETSHLCNDLTTTLTAVVAAPTQGIDNQCRPFTQDAGGNHTYTFDVVFPPGFDAFYLSGYTAQANATDPDTSEVEAPVFVQTTWDAATGSQHGDISFGSADEAGPVTSFAAEGANFECSGCEEAFPTPDTAFTLGASSTTLRIGWGEGGPQLEGWIPWASGTIFVR